MWELAREFETHGTDRSTGRTKGEYVGCVRGRLGVDRMWCEIVEGH